MEQPAVASDTARFRLQAMAEHGDDDVDTAVGILAVLAVLAVLDTRSREVRRSSRS